MLQLKTISIVSETRGVHTLKLYPKNKNEIQVEITGDQLLVILKQATEALWAGYRLVPRD